MRDEVSLGVDDLDVLAPIATPEPQLDGFEAFGDASADMVLFCLVLEHMEALAPPLREARRVLRRLAEPGAILAIAGVNAAMIFFGLLMESMNPDRDRVNWTPFWFGCVAGIVPWVIIGYQFLGADSRSPDGAPGFVYGIVISLFVLFNSFAVNMALQYRRIGPWRDYLFGERGYIVLSLVAKSALAWQVFANTLI